MFVNQLVLATFIQHTVKQESLVGVKFGKFSPQKIWQRKVWRTDVYKIIIIMRHVCGKCQLYIYICGIVIPPCVLQVRMVSPVTGSLSCSASFVVDLVICGYHIYKDIWPSLVVEEQLQCKWEVGNLHEFTDLISVAAKKLIDGKNTVVGHIPR